MAEQAAAASPKRPGVHVDLGIAQAGHVDHEPAVGRRFTGEAVAAALDGHQYVAFPREVHRIDDVLCRCTLSNHRRSLVIEHAIPDLSGCVVAIVTLQEQVSVEAAAKLLDRRRLDRQFLTACRNGRDRGSGIAGLLPGATGRKSSSDCRGNGGFAKSASFHESPLSIRIRIVLRV